jgi:hypothetical protein
MSDYLTELSTHYAQVRKRLRGEIPKKPMPIPPAPEIPAFAVWTNPQPEPEPVIVEPKRDFTLVMNHLPWEKEPEEKPKRRRSYKDVLEDVSRETGIAAKHIIGRSRTKHFTEARRYFWWRVVEECPHLSITDIGRRSGHDHTTVLHAVGRYEEILSGEFRDFRDKTIPREGREREPNGRYIRRRATNRKWCGLKGIKKVVE